MASKTLAEMLLWELFKEEAQKNKYNYLEKEKEKKKAKRKKVSK